jgi:hypothetical protein
VEVVNDVTEVVLVNDAVPIEEKVRITYIEYLLKVSLT